MERCQRCQGLLLSTFIQIDPLDGTNGTHPTSWRCINCGALADDQILENRGLIEKSLVIESRSSLRKGKAKKGRPRIHFPVSHIP